MIKIKTASPEMASTLTQVVIDSKKYWGYSLEQMTQWISGLTITGQFIAQNHVYVGTHATDGNIILVYALVEIDQQWAELEHCWIRPEYIGQGYGRLLFSHMEQNFRNLGKKYLRIVSDPNAEGFYLAMGAVRDGTVISQESGRKLPLLRLTLN